MGRKSKSELRYQTQKGPGTDNVNAGASPLMRNVPNRDLMQRMGFLYQASVYLDGLGTRVGLREQSVDVRNTGRNWKGKGRERMKKTHDALDLARSYVGVMQAVARKGVVPMDPSVKRTICKGCRCVLVPGLSVRLRTRCSKSRLRKVNYTCLRCGTQRGLPLPAAVLSTANDPDNNDDNKVLPSTMDSQTEPQAEGIRNENPRLDDKVAKTVQKLQKSSSRLGLPLATRLDAGHIVFRDGSQVSGIEEGGWGVFAL